MKLGQIFICVFVLFSSTAFGRIVLIEDKMYVRNDGKQTPLFLVNKLIKDKAISKVKLYGGGNVHVISFAKKGEEEKIYSVDNKGFVYAIEPFASYEISEVLDENRFRFKQEPRKSYHVTAKGFFIH